MFACISGWVMMLWKSQQDFEEGIHGGRRAPRCSAWYDLRRAFDVHMEVGDPAQQIMANRITVMTYSGNFYFCVELPEDRQVWYEALRRVIQDASLDRARAKDTELHKRKRWVAACGIAGALARGSSIGERAMAILFHAYDMDYDC